MKNNFNVTYEIWDESALEAGDTDDRGFLGKGLDLRSAVILLGYGSNGVYLNHRWIDTMYEMDYVTGAREYRSMHFPDGITESSKKRIMRLVETVDYS